MKEMNRTTLVWLLLIMAFIGIADSWYLAQSALEGASLVCNIGALDGCNTVAKSAYSKVWGIPLAVYGVAFYGLLFVVGALLLSIRTRILYIGALVLSGLGALASLYFLYLQLFVIEAVCIYCLISLGTAVLSLIAACVLWKKFAPPALVVVP